MMAMTVRATPLVLTIGHRIRQCRKARGLTQAQVSARCAQSGSFEPTQYAIGQLERGERLDITVRELLALALALDVSPADLLTDGDPIQITDTVTVASEHMRGWLAGKPLRKSA